MLNALNHFQRGVEHDDAGTLAQLRRRGAEAFRELGLPTLKQENWKYTNVTALHEQQFSLPDSEILDIEPNEGLAIEGLDENRMVFVNNIFQPKLSSIANLSPGASLTYGLDDGDTPILELGNIVDLAQHNFAALNQAFLRQFVWLNLEKNCQIDTPIYLLFIANPGAQLTMTHPRILITANQHTKASVIEHFVGDSVSESLTNTVTEVKLSAGAQIEHYKLQEQNENSYHFSGLHAQLGSDSKLVSHNIDVGGKLVRNDVVANLDAPGASVMLNGFYIAGTDQHVDNHTRINHLKPHTDSFEDYRGVVDGNGRCVFNGKVCVSPNAQKIEAHQSNNNLLLSENAEIDTKPELEIYADDVKCSHGATIGQIDKDALFYLRSRGIGTAVANTLLTFAFAESVIGRIKIEAVRKRMQSAVVKRLPDHDRIEEFL